MLDLTYVATFFDIQVGDMISMVLGRLVLHAHCDAEHHFQIVKTKLELLQHPFTMVDI